MATIFKDFFFISVQTWDLISIRGFVFWSGAFLLPLALVSAILQGRTFLFFSVSLLTITSIAVTGAYWYPWYEFPLIITLLTLSLQTTQRSWNGNLLHVSLKNAGIALIALTIPFSAKASFSEVSLNSNWHQDLKSTELCEVSRDRTQNAIDLALISKSIASPRLSYYEANVLLIERIQSNFDTIQLLLGSSSKEKYMKQMQQDQYTLVLEDKICGTISIFTFQKDLSQE
jgi:hypothetical protein